MLYTLAVILVVLWLLDWSRHNPWRVYPRLARQSHCRCSAARHQRRKVL